MQPGRTCSTKSGGSCGTCLYHADTLACTSLYADYIDQDKTQRGIRRRGTAVPCNYFLSWRMSSRRATAQMDSAKQTLYGYYSGGTARGVHRLHECTRGRTHAWGARG